jgi:hypothetical protein
MERFCLKTDLNMAKGDKIVLFSKDSRNNRLRNSKRKPKKDSGILIGV